jgi:hypothetical protein
VLCSQQRCIPRSSTESHHSVRPASANHRSRRPRVHARARSRGRPKAGGHERRRAPWTFCWRNRKLPHAPHKKRHVQGSCAPPMRPAITSARLARYPEFGSFS